jgi:hypothetical protein
MTRNRKAELQRKLTMSPVATPPAGLADRIKAAIPQNLGSPVRREPARSGMWSGFNLRVAASLVLFVSSLYLAFHLTSRSNVAPPPATAVSATRDDALAPRAGAALPTTPPAPGSARMQARPDLPTMPDTPPPSSVANVPATRVQQAQRKEAIGMTTGVPALADNTSEAPLAKTETIMAGNQAGAAPALQPSAPAAAEAPMQDAAERSLASERPVAKMNAARDRFSPEPQPAVRNFVAVEEAIARGETPREADAGAIVQHFAAPQRVPSRLQVELEASSAPLDSTKFLLRVSIDGVGAAASGIELTFGEAVASHRALTGSPSFNTTALYEIGFTATAGPDQTVATLRCGQSVSRIRVADLHRWSNASTRMKRASLAAAWTQTLRSGEQTDAVVAKAREAHFDDLADMAGHNH